MAYVLDTQINLSPLINKTYYISSAHRNIVTADKSRWIISMSQEVDCFVEGQTLNWVESNLSWGIMFNGSGLDVLGTDHQDHPLKIAKFIDSSNNNIWHGYPADYVRKQQDRSGMAILVQWRSRKMIAKHHIIKIRQGKSCSL